MTYEELNEYILNYLDDNDSIGALIITSKWGSGKTYYVQNSLKKVVEKDGKFKISIVSAYGLKDIKDLTKTIIINLYAKFCNNKKVKAGATILKYFVNSFAKYKGINLDILKMIDVETLCEFVKLDESLIIIDDLERSKLDISEIMGVINDLCENAHAKVILVVNEEELVEKNKAFNIDNEKYKMLKEKTIIDTLQYECDYYKVFCELLCNKNDILNNIIKDYNENNRSKFILEIIDAFVINCGCENLRIYIKAFKKIYLFLDKINNNYDIAFVKEIIDCILYQYIYNNDPKASIGNNMIFDESLLLLVNDVIHNKTIDNNVISQLYAKYKNKEKGNIERNIYENSKEIIFEYFEEEQVSVEKAINDLYECLVQGIVEENDYMTIANYLCAINDVVDNKDIVENCLNVIIKNVTKSNELDEIKLDIFNGLYLDTKESREQFENFKCNIRKAWLLGNKKTKMLTKDAFENQIKNIDDFLGINNNIKTIVKNNPDEILEIIKELSAKQLNRLRGLILNEYKICDYKEDESQLKKIIVGIDEILTDYDIKDNIIKLQLNWLKNNIEGIINS